jgi:hypothetical protein
LTVLLPKLSGKTALTLPLVTLAYVPPLTRACTLALGSSKVGVTVMEVTALGTVAV